MGTNDLTDLTTIVNMRTRIPFSQGVVAAPPIFPKVNLGTISHSPFDTFVKEGSGMKDTSPQMRHGSVGGTIREVVVFKIFTRRTEVQRLGLLLFICQPSLESKPMF